MKKLICLMILLYSCTFWSQDSIVISPKKSKKFTIKDLIVDHNDNIASRHFDPNFKKKYQNSDFIYEYQTPEKNIWDRFVAWLANVFKNLFSFTDTKSSLQFVKILLKTLAFLLVAFVIYLLTKALINKEGNWIFGQNNSGKKTIDYNDVEKNLFDTDFEILIKKSLEKDDNRLVIRYYYLYLLKIMATKNIIEWDIEKTNSDYLFEIRNKTQQADFEYLSYLYNYIWYGEFDFDKAIFDKASSAYEKTIKTIKNG